MMTKNSAVNIVGGGMIGLTTAYILARAGHQVRVIEASDKVGGLLSTFEVAGTKLEHYYHHFFTHDLEILWLIEELGIEDQLRFHASSIGMYAQQKVYPFGSIPDLLSYTPLPFKDKALFALSSYYLGKLANWKKNENISALEWFDQYAGSKVTQQIWEPLLKVKFGPFADNVPLSWMIGRLSQRMNSRKRGGEKLGYIQGSLDVLLKALLKKLKELDVEFIFNSPVTGLEKSNQKISSVVCHDQKHSADFHILTVPSPVISNWIQFDSELQKKLNQIEYFGAICVVLELQKKLSSIYWTNVVDSALPFGGVIEHTNWIDPSQYDGKHIVYLSRYFSKNEDLASMTDKDIETRMLSGLHQMFPNLNKKDINQTRVFKTKYAAFACDLNFSRQIPSFETSISNLFIANMPHVYPDERSVNNSIRIAANACNHIGFDTSYIPQSRSLAGLIG